MPFISDRQLGELQNYVDKNKMRARRATEIAKEKARRAIGIAEAVGAASAMGFARGKFEDASGAWNIPGTTIDVEMVTGLAGVAAALGFEKSLGKYADDVLWASSGILAHYTGQIARKYAKTGEFSMIAGAGGSMHGGHAAHHQLSVGDNWDPVSFNPTQISAPYDDPVAMALAQSGV